jgi:hypothetical protein
MISASPTLAQQYWTSFITWMREAHPRAEGQVALIRELLQNGTTREELSGIEERMWPEGRDLSATGVLRRGDRLRRMLSDLRRRVSEYNRLYASINGGMLVLRTQGGSPEMPVLDFATARIDKTSGAKQRTSASPASPATMSPAEITPADAILLVTRLAEDCRASQRESRRAAELLLQEISGRTYAASNNPMTVAELAIQCGAGHEVEFIARCALATASIADKPALTCIWAEACDAVGMGARLRPQTELLRQHAQANCLGSAVAYRIRRLYWRAKVRSSWHLSDFEAEMDAAIHQAEAADLYLEAGELRLLRAAHATYEAERDSRPSLYHQVLEDLQALTLPGAYSQPQLALPVRFAYWKVRSLAQQVPLQELQLEANSLILDMLSTQDYLQAARMEGFRVHALARHGLADDALDACRKNCGRRVRFMDRAGLLYSLRNLSHLVTATGRSHEEIAAINTLSTALREITSGQTQPGSKANPLKYVEQLRDLSNLLPVVSTTDWNRLLYDIPPLSIAASAGSVYDLFA